MNKVKEYDAISIGDSISMQLNPDEDEYDDDDEALPQYLDSEYNESNFAMDGELDLGEAPAGDYAILETKESCITFLSCCKYKHIPLCRDIAVLISKKVWLTRYAL